MPNFGYRFLSGDSDRACLIHQTRDKYIHHLTQPNNLKSMLAIKTCTCDVKSCLHFKFEFDFKLRANLTLMDDKSIKFSINLATLERSLSFLLLQLKLVILS